MAYTQNTWVKGDTISSAKMNHIEDGISQVDARVGSIENSKDHTPHFKGDSLLPVYTGDYLEEWRYLTGCCLKLGDFFYTFNAPLGSVAEAEHTNTGTIRKFDPINNVEITDWKKTREIGHANSCACDGTYIYVAPVADYSGETLVHPTWLYRFDMNFDPAGLENIPVSYAQGVSYDPVTQKLYIMDSSRRIWVKENGEWSLFTSVDLSSIPENEFIPARKYNQDMAVYGGRYYIISPYRNIISGLMTPGTSVPDSGYTLASVDSSFRFYLGETEGMEFDANGHLYYADYCNILNSYLRNVFIMEIPVGEQFANSSSLSGGSGFGYGDGEVTLTEANKTAFRLLSHQLRCISQMDVRLVRYNTSLVTIPEGNNIVEDYVIRINDKIKLCIDGKLTVSAFDIYNGKLTLASDIEDNNVPRLVCTGNRVPFALSRAGDVTFAGDYAVRISVPNYNGSRNLVNPSTDYGLTIFRRVPIRHEGNDFTFGGKTIAAGTMYVGTSKVIVDGIQATTSDMGALMMANDAKVKEGTNYNTALSPYRQHLSTFYGLAKAAGDNTQAASSNPVGTYTDSAKEKIKEMLGVESVENVTGTTPSIAGVANTRYVCGEVASISITPPASGIIDVLFESGSTPAVLTVPNTVMFPSWFDKSSLEANTVYEINIMDGIYGAVTTWG